MMSLVAIFWHSSLYACWWHQRRDFTSWAPSDTTKDVQTFRTINISFKSTTLTRREILVLHVQIKYLWCLVIHLFSCFDEVVPRVIMTHCFVHWHIQHWCQRHCQQSCKKSCPLPCKSSTSSEPRPWTTIFSRDSDKKCKQNMKFLYSTEADLLSRGHALKCLIELWTQVSLFLTQGTPTLITIWQNGVHSQLGLLRDVNSHMNMVDLLIQGPIVVIMNATIKAVLARAATLTKENGGGQLHKLSYAEGNTSAGWLWQLWGCIKFLFRHKSPHLKTQQNSCEGYFRSIIILSLLIQNITDAGLVKDNLNNLRIQEIMWHYLNRKGLGEGCVSQCRPTVIWYSKPWKLWFCLPLHTFVSKSFQHFVAIKSH